MTVYAITDTKKGRTGIAPTYLQTTPEQFLKTIMTRQWDRTAYLKRSRREISHCASRQLGEIKWSKAPI